MIHHMNFRAYSGLVLGVRQTVTSVVTLIDIGPSLVSLLLITIEARTSCSFVTSVYD
jgi:hypothetical protein